MFFSVHMPPGFEVEMWSMLVCVFGLFLFFSFVLFWWKSWGEIDVGLKWCQIRELRKNFSCLLPCFTSWIGVVLIWLSVLNFLAIGMWIIVSSLVKHLFTHVLICLWIQKQVFYLCFHDSDDFQLKICFLIDFWMRWCYHCFLLIKKSHVLAWKPALILKIIVECWYVIFRGLKNENEVCIPLLLWFIKMRTWNVRSQYKG